MPRTFPIRNLLPVVSRTESTEIGRSLTKAQNTVLRPKGAFRCAPILRKIWGFGESTTPFATFDALSHPSGSGTIGAADETIAVRIYLQGHNILMFFNMWTGTHNGQSVTPGERGTFYLGKDAGSVVDFDPAAVGPPLFEVLAYGLDPAARWMGSFAHGQLDCQNGVDDAVAVQLDRTATPGKWRKRASNAKPNTPVISLIEPQSSLNTQATRVVTGRAGGVDLIFTANSDNFPGIYGNSKIKVLIQYAGAYSTGAITSSISGDGTASSPHIYTLFTTSTSSSNNAIIAFVNTDTNARPILLASGASAYADTFDDTAINPTGVFLTGGAGTGDSIGLSNEVVDVYACYWDGGTRNLGYQGVKSNPSNEIIIDGTTNKDLLVQVDVDETAESGRFSHAAAGIRIFKRFQETADSAPFWSMMNEGTPLPNSHRAKVVTASTTSQKIWSVDALTVGEMSSAAITGNLVTSPFQVSNGSVLVSESAAHGIVAQTKLYVTNAQQDTPTPGSTKYNLSLTLGGAAITITSNGSIFLLKLAPHSWATTDIITFPSASGGTPPSPLAADTRYYIKSVDTDGYGVTLSESRLGGAITLTAIGHSSSIKVVAVTMTIGSGTEPGRALPPDQSRPPAHRYIAMSGSFNWVAGVTNNESNVYSSKEWQHDELDPEGVDLEDIDAISPKRSLGGNAVKVSGLWSDQQNLHVHFRDAIVIIDPANTTNTQEPMIDSGMMNGMCASNSDRNRIVFLGGDERVMEFNGARYGDRSSRSKSDDALLYIKQYINDNLVETNTDQCCILHDKVGQMFWFWMPSSNGSVGFAYDEMLDGIVGPFTSPCRLTSTCNMGSTLGTYIVANAAGYLFYWDTFDQGEFGDKLTTLPPVLHEAGDALPADHVGYDTTEIMVTGVAKTLHYSQRTILETGLIDLGDAATMKKFLGVQWRSVSGSRAYIKATLISSNGLERGVWYGEIGAKQRNRPHQVLINMVDTAIKIRFDVYSADLIPWVIRDIDLIVQ